MIALSAVYGTTVVLCWFLNLHLQYAVLSIIICFTYTFTLHNIQMICVRSAEREYPSGQRAGV